MSPDEFKRELPQLPRLVDAWQGGTLDEPSHQQLTHLLQTRRDARQYFLEQCQIDAELRWRFAAQKQVAGTLALHHEGSTRPIAAILLSGLGFRDDPGFPALFDKLEGCEPLAHRWLQVYLTLRACLVLWQPRVADAQATVAAICDELAGHPLVDLSPEQFSHLAWEVTCRAVRRRAAARSEGPVRSFASILLRCLELSEQCNVVAVYESFEGFVPRHVPAEVLRLLGARYLLEQSPDRMATTLHLSELTIRRRLAQVRLQIWKSCAEPLDIGPAPEDLQGLSAFIWAADQPRIADQAVTLEGRRQSSEKLWLELEGWTASSADNCHQFLTFAILHEALFRRLSLNHLLEVSKTRRDEEFHHVVTDLVRHLEADSVRRRREPEVPLHRPSIRTPVPWLVTTAAALAIAATTFLWKGGDPPGEPPSQPPIAKQSLTPSGTASIENSPAQAPPIRVLAAVVKSALPGTSPGDLHPPGTSLFAGDRVDLTAGILHLSTPSGSEWVLEGPVSVELKEPGELSLLHGKLVGLNRGEGETLVVRTPTAHVLDRGTEFGVAVADDQTTSVAVYDGAVDLSRAAESADTSGDVVRLEADFEAAIPPAGPLPSEPVRSLHDRAFIRPDEVALREEQRQGSSDAAQKVAFFELLRVEGLLAYQGFDGPSRGEKFRIGFHPPRTTSPVQFGENLATSRAPDPSSRSLLLANGTTVFLDLDVSDRAPLARAGLITESRLVGGQSRELWLSWRSKSLLPAGQRFQWSGLSIMHGDSRQFEEPAFIGQPSNSDTLGLQVFNGPEEFIQPLDTGPTTPDAQTLPSDDQLHLWVVRITMQEDGSGSVAAWCDVNPANITSTPPHGEYQVTNLKFDRLRLEVSPEGDAGQCAFDEIYLTTTLEALAEAMGRREGQSTL